MRSLFAMLTGGAVVVLLAGCVFIPVPSGGHVDPDDNAAQGKVVSTDCAGRDMVVNQSESSMLLTGECASLTIRGTDIVVTVGSVVGALSVQGDRATVSAGPAGRIEIGGNDNTVEAGAVSTVEIEGDRNTIGGGTLGSVKIRGNDNVVGGRVSGSVVKSGDRNTVGG